MIEDTLIGEAGELADALTRWRRDFHRHPEVGLECHRTAERVCDVLQEVGIEVSRGWAKTGVVAIVSPEAEKKGSAEAVALRVDMDGLPVHEETGASYASTRAGYAHACGHDGHVAIGLGVAYLLNRHRRELASPVKLIFQPGEESPGGARLMLEEGVLRDPPVGAVFGLHLFPGLPAGQIGLRYGVMTAGSNDFTVTLRGKAGHAGHPHLAVDPVPALAAFIDAVQSLVSRAHNPLDPLIISFGRLEGGSALNVIPGEITLGGTVRTLSESTAGFALRRLQEILAGLRFTHGVEGVMEEGEKEPPLVCDRAVTAYAERLLKTMWGEHRVELLPEPSMGAEDFAQFSRVVPSTYLRFGVRDEEKGFTYPLHHPAFDFGEEILPVAVASLAFLLLEWERGESREAGERETPHLR